MIRNYFKIAWRNLWRNKFFSIINITGLSLGIVFSLLIFLWVKSELNVDAYHLNNSRLYQVYEREYYDHKIDGNYDTAPILSNEIKKEIPEVEYAITLQEENSLNTFKVGTKMLKVEGTASSPDIFKMFSYPLLEGTPQSAINSPISIAISRKIAELFFGSPKLAMGKTIEFENKREFTVTAVFENLSDNNSRKFDYLMNWDTFSQDHPWTKGWEVSGPRTFVMLRSDANSAFVERKIIHFMDRFKKVDATYRIELGLQRFSDIYLHSNFKNGVINGGRIEYVNLFIVAAIFILLIACINFMNLTTARSVRRAREVGIRKVSGAVRSTLITQFIGEAIFITLISVSGSLILINLLLPVFNNITLKHIALPFNQLSFWFSIAFLTVITGCISGSYPALFLSSFNPVKVLKGPAKIGLGPIIFRKGLVVFQFVLAVLFIIGTIIVSNQIGYIQGRNLGYDKQNLIYIPMDGELKDKFQVFKDEALRMPGIQSISHISDNPTSLDNQNNAVDWSGKDPLNKVQFSTTEVGYDFSSTMKMQMVKGRDFSPEYPTDSAGFIINETAMKRMGLADPIGEQITFGPLKGKVIGVLKDFNFESLHQQIEPLIIRFEKNYGYYLLVRTQPGKTRQALTSLQSLFKQMNPNFPFSYSFSDHEYQKLYTSEKVVGKLANYFCFLAIFISCLGLLGLAIFTAEQRVKEIGIRKVLGASVISLFVLLSSEFLVLIIVAILIASPIAWYSMNIWLQGYSYRVSISLNVFVMSSIVIIIVALVSVSFQTIKASLINPIKSLRSE
ncbi:ABC transporter permease [Mucilaginibacter lappiensis]|uniref:ABC-type antimicrobial peptide transport system permease subunit n=1 Tax=Mucilaginibacter lappiensis TaxID=354630 RepID=A0A841J9J1_9SPHI|nr:ABC transporter permease [Mucilaginibacter lappiensis]MBB6127430.1 ABC-type antimicrobial peptide transport system permease subunit [Mucilaginibacter lappiensis]